MPPPIDPGFSSFLNRFDSTSGLASAYWAILSPKEKLEFLLNAPRHHAASVTPLAIDDACDLVRMIACSPEFAHESVQDRLDEMAKDKSMYVRASAHAHSPIATALTALSQRERVLMIGLKRRCLTGDFVKALKAGLTSGTLSDKEAAELVRAFSKNPNLVRDYEDPESIRDGIDFWSVNSSFKKFWQFGAESPMEVALAVADYFPTGSSKLCEVPLDLLTPAMLEALVYRKYEPLLRRIRENPSAFSDSVVKAAAP